MGVLLLLLLVALIFGAGAAFDLLWLGLVVGAVLLIASFFLGGFRRSTSI